MTIPVTVTGSQPDSPIDVPGYAIPPNAVLRDPQLSITARLLYAVLDGRRASNRGKGIRVQIETLAADLGCSSTTVRRAATELQDAGWLQRRRTGRSSSWQLENPVRSNRRVAAIERSLQGELVESPVSPSTGITGNHGNQRAAAVPALGALGDHTCPKPALSQETAVRPITPERSECSPVDTPQSITKEKYNSTADPVSAPASGGALKDGSQRGEASILDDQPNSRPEGSSAKQMPAGSGIKEKSAKTKTAAARDPLTLRYLAEINAATGANLRPTPQLQELIHQIAAQKIPAAEAAMTAKAWLAVRDGKVDSPSGFLVAVALPSLANGEKQEKPAVTPIPPAYSTITAEQTCSHGAARNRCALCRQPVREQPAAPPSWAVEPAPETPNRCMHGEQMLNRCHACGRSGPSSHPHLDAALAKLGSR